MQSDAGLTERIRIKTSCLREILAMRCLPLEDEHQSYTHKIQLLEIQGLKLSQYLAIRLQIATQSSEVSWPVFGLRHLPVSVGSNKCV